MARTVGTRLGRYIQSLAALWSLSGPDSPAPHTHRRLNNVDGALVHPLPKFSTPGEVTSVPRQQSLPNSFSGVVRRL